MLPRNGTPSRSCLSFSENLNSKLAHFGRAAMGKLSITINRGAPASVEGPTDGIALREDGD